MILEFSKELKLKWRSIFVRIILGGIIEGIMVLIILVAGILFMYTDILNETILWLKYLPLQIIALLYFVGMLFFRLRLYFRGRKCNLKATKKGRLVKMEYCYRHDGNIITDSDQCHSLDEDFTVLDLKTYQGQVMVNRGTEIPILVYQGRSIVLFHQCGFYDIAHVSRKLDGWDFYP